ncbi:glycolate oxidase subunit GlcE [Sphingobium chungbukense]|uniref:FAD-linked oxidase n=1 Tax=Sphingobium chungbukense TaxID=56193 RepID=A0A0M3ASR9_9SPHN|nr:glycolate oxidase subunit GlcE [Sphingobium chungbukense]KKW91579.1 FAD-linked oxidase [Sphingobium chungbukense]
MHHQPTSADDLAAIITDAAARGARCEIRGGGSKAGMGAPRDAEVIDMRGFTGVVDYDPPELVLTVRAGTPLAEVQRLIAGEGQMLAFEPFDHGPLLGGELGQATIGGVVAAGVAGPQRLTMGGARDHLLGVTAVSGRGERFVAGAKVVKNVTGYDLPKLMANNWGRLAAMTELTLKVLPRPRATSTMVLEGLDHIAAVRAMACAMGSHAEIGAAAHLPGAEGRRALTLLRVQGFAPSVTARCAILPDLLRDHGAARLLPEEKAAALWDAVRDVTPLADAPTLWRISLPPFSTPALLDRFALLGARWLLDWAGGLVWLAHDGDATEIRSAAAMAGGHAMLIRAPEPIRAAIPMQHPRQSGVAALEARVRRSFDPAGVFETGRFLDMPHAD